MWHCGWGGCQACTGRCVSPSRGSSAHSPSSSLTLLGTLCSLSSTLCSLTMLLGHSWHPHLEPGLTLLFFLIHGALSSPWLVPSTHCSPRHSHLPVATILFKVLSASSWHLQLFPAAHETLHTTGTSAPAWHTFFLGSGSRSANWCLLALQLDLWPPKTKLGTPVILPRRLHYHHPSVPDLILMPLT